LDNRWKSDRLSSLSSLVNVFRFDKTSKSRSSEGNRTLQGSINKLFDFRLHFHGRLLQGQTFTAFGAAPVDHPASGLGGHPRTESMGTHSSDFARLIGSLHALFPL
jgi:hypothetical protein